MKDAKEIKKREKDPENSENQEKKSPKNLKNAKNSPKDSPKDKDSKEKYYLQNHFLLAMPSAEDPVFHRTVIYLCEHNQNGAVGIIINRPTTISLVDVLGDMKINIQDDIVRHTPVLFGGPVHQERGFVIHSDKGSWRSTLSAGNDIFITTSRDILEAIAVHQGPARLLVALGCCAWEPGQLEAELKENLWLIVSSNPFITFEAPFESRYIEGMTALGIDLSYLSDEAGHA